MAAFEELKEANPSGRFWLKLDATDLKDALIESMKSVWNGDVDLGDGKLQEFRGLYNGRVNLVTGLTGCVSHGDLEVELRSGLVQFEEDIESLDDGFIKAVEEYQKKYNNPSSACCLMKGGRKNHMPCQ